jgi:hypothetical protein
MAAQPIDEAAPGDPVLILRPFVKFKDLAAGIWPTPSRAGRGGAGHYQA